MSEATGEKVEIQKSCTDLCFLIIQAVVTLAVAQSILNYIYENV